MKSERLQNFHFVFLFVFMLLNTVVVFAGPSQTTYQARIVKPDGFALEANNVNFQFSILDQSGSCILYTETFSAVNMGSSGGFVAFTLGTGVRTFPVSGSTFEQVFSNTSASLVCSAGGPGTYSPSATDTRKIVMQFNDGAGWQTLPAMTINAVPYAMYANDSYTFRGRNVTDFVQVASLEVCDPGEAMHYNGAGFTCITAGGGSVTSGSVVTALGYTPADAASYTTVTNNLNTVSSTLLSVSSTVFSVSSTVASLAGSISSLQSTVAASFAALAGSQWVTSGTSIHYSTGNVGIGTSAPAFPLEVAGDLAVWGPGLNGSSAQKFAMKSNATGGWLEVPRDGSNNKLNFAVNWRGGGTPGLFINGASMTVGIGHMAPMAALDVSGAIRISYQDTCAASYAGSIRYNSGAVEFCNGTSWSAFGSGGGSVTSSSIVTALGYTPADAVSVTTLSSTVSSQASIVATSFTSVTSLLTSVSNSITALSGQIGSIQSSQWVSNSVGGVSSTFVMPSSYGPLGQLGTQLTVPTAGSVDDGYYTIALPFAVNFNGTNYSTIYVGTNSYVTFGGGTNVYSSLSGTNPNLNKILVNSADRSSNSVWFYSDASSFSIRYEGGCTTAPGNALVWELQGNTGNSNQLKLQVISVCSGGISMVGDTTTQLQSLAANAGTAHTVNYGISSGGNIYYTSGHVGIGTSNPSVRLDVSHDAASTYGLRLKSTTSATTGGMYIENDSGDSAILQVGNSAQAANLAGHVILQSANKDMIFRSAGAERVRMLASGEMGIGVATPYAKLDVSGAIRISMENNCAVSYAGTIRYNAGSVQVCDGSGWQTFSTGAVTSAAVVAAFGYTPANSTSVTSSITTVSNSVGVLTSTVAAIKSSQWTDLSTGSTLQLVTTPISFAPGGQLGTQLTVPTAGSVDDGYYTITLPFAVNFNGTSYTTVHIGTNSYATFGGGTTVYNTLSPTNPALNKIMINSADRGSNSIWYFGDASSFNIRYEGGCGTAPGTALVWELQGSSANPSQLKVHVVSVCSGGYSTISSPSAELRSIAAIASSSFQIDYAPAPDSIYYSGNVGIGTSSPVTKLDVAGGVRIGMESAICAVGYAGTLRYNAGNVEFCNGTTWASFSGGAVTSASVASALGSSTNVGIGTNSPTQALHVSGTVRITGGAPGAGKVLTSDASGNATWQTVSGDNLGNHTATQNINLGTHKLVGNGGSEGIAIDSSGNVRLGFIGGNAALTMGPATSTVSSSWGSMAVGFDAQASSISTFAFGSGVRASNWYAFATGNDNIAAGKASAVFGQLMTVNSDYSVGFGLSSSVSYTMNTPSTMAVMGGKVGIGTTTPAASLEVATENAVYPRGIISTYYNDNSWGSYFVARSARGTSAAASQTTINKNLGGFVGQGYGLTGWGTPSAELTGMIITATENWTDSALGSKVRFHTIPNGSNTAVERLVIDQNGNIGMGIDTPVTNLHVKGGVSYGALMLGANGGTSNHHLTHETDGSFGIFTGTFGSGIRQLIIDSAGRMGLGLGNNAPGATLHVSGTARFTDGNQAAGRVLASDVSGNAAWKQTIITKTGSPVGNSSTVNGARVSAGYTLTLPPGKWKIEGMGITTQVSCRANFGIRSTPDTVVKYTIFPEPNGDWQTANVMAYVDISSTTTYELFISSRDNCTSQIHTDPFLWEFVATGVAY